MLPIVHIINCSIINGTVPDELKVARIVPIHKKGDKLISLIIDQSQ